MGYGNHQTQPKITLIPFTDGTVELSHVFDPNVKKFDVSSRFGNTFRISYEEDGTSGNYKTVPQDTGYFEDFIKDSLTLYILVPNATSEDPETIEILEWKSTD